MSNVVDSFMRATSQMPAPLDAFDLCRLASHLLKTPIEVIADSELPKRAPGLLMRRTNQTFLIIYCSSASSLLVQSSILHELAHILLGHRQTTLRSASEKSFYTDSLEREAERLAHQLMALMVRELPIETNEIAARFARLMPRHPTQVLTVNPSANPRPARRFQALMGD